MDDKWNRLEEIVRRVVREELEAMRKPAKKYEPSIKLEGRIWVGISETQMESWKSAYPSVDVDGELKRAAAWILSNPSDAPKSQFGRFLNAWFSRTQNKSALNAMPQKSNGSAPSTAARNCGICGSRANLQVAGEWRCLAHRFEEPPMLRMVK